MTDTTATATERDAIVRSLTALSCARHSGETPSRLAQRDRDIAALRERLAEIDTAAFLAEEAARKAAALTGPVPDAVTDRVADLIHRACAEVNQAVYEGSHTVRQDLSPVYGSPWATPDLPADVHNLLVEAQDLLAQAARLARQHRDA